MASDDPNYNSLHQTNVGCFGLFESIDDRDVAAALFDAAASWLRKKGRTEIMGPIDYSTNYVCALLIDGFEFPPTVLTAHNPPYYRELIEGCGFTKAKDWYAWWFADPSKAVAQFATARDSRSQALPCHFSSSAISKIFGMKADGSVKFTTKRGKRTGALCHSQKRRSSS